MNAVANFHMDGADVVGALQGMVLGFAHALKSPHSIKDHPITRSTSKDLQPLVTSVLDFLDKQVEMFDGLSEVGSNLAKALRGFDHQPGKFVDPSLVVTRASRRAAAALRVETERLASARSSAFGDENLGRFDRDRLVGKFYDCKLSAEKAIEVVESVIAAIQFHDEACMDEAERGISTLEDLAHSLHGEEGLHLAVGLKNAERSEKFSFAGAKRELLSRT